MNDYEDCTCDDQPEEVTAVLPCWRFSLWDIAGIGLTTLGGLASVLGQGINLLATECAAAANFQRQEFDMARAEAERRKAAEALEAMYSGVARPVDPS